MLSQFSRVEACRREQLLGTWYLNAGIHELDTDRLPLGNYDITLRVYERDHLVREDTIAFNKRWASFGDMQWDGFIQAGKVKNESNSFLEKQSKYKDSVTFGGRIPMTNKLSFQQGGAITDNEEFYESGLTWNTVFFDGSLSSNLSFLYGKSSGNYQSLSYNTQGVSFSFYRSDKKVKDCEQNYNIGWSGCYESLSASVSFPVLEWQTVIGYSDSNNKAKYRYEYYDSNGYYAHTYRGRTKRWQLNTTKSLQWNDLNIIPNMGIYRSSQDNKKEDHGVFLSLSLFKVNNDNDKYTSLSAGYSYLSGSDVSDTNSGYLEARRGFVSNGTSRELGLRFSNNDNNLESVVSGYQNNKFGNLNGSLSVSKEHSESKYDHSFSMGYSSSFALTSNGFYWGGNAQGTSQLSGNTIKVKSNDSENELAEISGGYGKYSLRNNDAVFVPQPAFTNTSINITEFSKGDVNVNLSSSGYRDLFLLPGHVYPIEINAKVNQTYVGRAIDEHGESLSNAYILNAPSFRLDYEGGFSFEYEKNSSSIYLLKNREIFKCPLPNKKTKHSLVYVGIVKCDKINDSSIPLEISTQHKVKELLANR